MESKDPAPPPTTVAPALPRLSSLAGVGGARELAAALEDGGTGDMLRLLRTGLAASGELARPLTLLAFGRSSPGLERALHAEGLGHLELLPSPGEARTLADDLEDGAFREMLPRVDVAFLRGVLEDLADPVTVLRGLADRARYLVFSYGPRLPRHLTEIEVRILARSLGAELVCERGLDPRTKKPVLACFVRTTAAARTAA